MRRNLFNQEGASPSKRNKLPRSRSVSAVEGLKRKRRDSESEGKMNQQQCENGEDDYSSVFLLSDEVFVSFREAQTSDQEGV